MRNLIN